MCKLSTGFIAARYFWGVAEYNDKRWPITDADLIHGGGHKKQVDPYGTGCKFIKCGGLTPRAANVEVSHSLGSGYTIQWDNDHTGCVPGITINKIQVRLVTVYKNARGSRCGNLLSGSSTSDFISVGMTWDSAATHSAIVTMRPFPIDVVYGSPFYSYTYRVPVPRQ